MFALFTAIPLVGHINPLLRQAEEMQRRGWRVAFAGTRESAGHVARESPSTPFIDLGELGGVMAALRRDQQRASVSRDLALSTLAIVRGLMASWPVMFDGLTAAIARDRPDVVVVDLFTAAGVCAADAAAVPVVINNADVLAAISARLLPPADHLPLLFSGVPPRAIRPWQRRVAPIVREVAAIAASATIGRDLNRHRRTRGLDAIDIHERLRGRPTLVDGVFGLEYERPLPPWIVMAGPMLQASYPALPPELNRWLSDGPPVVYCNLGTLAVASNRQLQVMTEALTIDGVRALWILRDDQSLDLAKLPGSIRVMSWGPPPLAVLAHHNVKAFVTHCGINSVYEAIAAGTPIVGIPMFADQRDMAVMAAEAGIGVWFDRRSLSVEALRSGIEQVLSDPAFATRTQPIQRAIADAGGVTRAAEVISAAAG